MQTDDNFDPVAGQVILLAPGLRRILAANPSPMTQRGTNTYILGNGHVAVIDPGPADPAHLRALLAALKGEVVEAILITHSHLDHSPLATDFSKHTGAPILAFGNQQAGRSPVMQALADSGLAGGGEGVDLTFSPDRCLSDGEIVTGTNWQVTALWTPGHMSNHMCFAFEDVLFTGDHVMGWASSLVSPPDGDLTAFMASCHRLALRQDRVYYPGHGAPIAQPSARLAWLIKHRLSRETQILAALSAGPATSAELTERTYTDVAPALIPSARRNILAHLIDLYQRNLVTQDGKLGEKSCFILNVNGPERKDRS